MANLLKGIDISHWQTVTSWSAIAEQVDFVFLKATEGDYYLDPTAVNSFNHAKAQGLLVGFYHFARFSGKDDAVKEAEYFVSKVGHLDVDLPFILDLESDDHGLSKQELTDCAIAFLDKVKELTKKPVAVYTYPYFIKTQVTKDLGAYPLWYANYSGDEADGEVWDEWFALQYTSKGRINGISGNVDLDYLVADFAEKLGIKKGKGDKKPAPAKPKHVTSYQVKSGDTLSGIAQRFNTSVKELQRINGIKNANLIYPNQVIKLKGTAQSHSKPATRTYRVRKGDNLSAIAKRFNTTVGALANANGISNPNVIYPNQVLRIPNGRASVKTYVVQKGDNLTEIAKKFGTTPSHLARINHLDNPNLIYPNQRLRVN